MSALRTQSLGLRAHRAIRVTPAAAHGLRFASSSSSTDASADASTSSASASTAAPTKLPMPWSEYLSMRKRRKQWATLTSVPSSLTGLFLGGSYFANLEGDPTQTIMGLDPMLVYGGSTVACMLLGWLVGPSIGGGLFSLTHPKLARGNPPPIETMDREFYSRIKAKRADPKFQSVNNPAPDFYGEKIVSVESYRRWLKDQKAYERKASHGVEEDM